MRSGRVVAVVFALLGGYWAAGTFHATAQVNSNDNRISMMDDCKPGEPGWNATGGCTLHPHQGDVTPAEFDDLLTSPLIPTTVGHPSWRNEPAHITADEGKTIRITNDGGRNHTFTEVEEFGGGFVPILRVGMTPAPECNPAAVTIVPGGGSQELTGLEPGLHKFQCCIHSWMRATIRVE
jgi:plastocyanin